MASRLQPHLRVNVMKMFTFTHCSCFALNLWSGSIFVSLVDLSREMKNRAWYKFYGVSTAHFFDGLTFSEISQSKWLPLRVTREFSRVKWRGMKKTPFLFCGLCVPHDSLLLVNIGDFGPKGSGFWTNFMNTGKSVMWFQSLWDDDIFFELWSRTDDSANRRKGVLSLLLSLYLLCMLTYMYLFRL